MEFFDNRRASDTLVVFLHGLGGDGVRLEPVLRALPYRMIAPTVTGFEPGTSPRPALHFDDHSRLMRILVQELVREVGPRTVILAGHSAGGDQFLRLMSGAEDPGLPVAGLLALGPNLSLDTCFVSRLFAQLDPAKPESMLETLKALGNGARSLPLWLAVQSYIANTFLKFGAELEPLRLYSAEIVAPFEEPGADPMARWFSGARERVSCLRLVFSNEEAVQAEQLLARHLERNVLGDGFSERSFVIEPVHHLELLEPELVLRHLREMLEELGAR
jgi:pimeloyl-ACP methyl ester carboxylesterase